MSQVFRSGRATAVLTGTDVHVLKPSKSSYGLFVRGIRYSYCCQDGCCDSGLAADVLAVVKAAKEVGATRVVIRTGQRGYYVQKIADLPVADVSDHVGRIDGEHEVARSW